MVFPSSPELSFGRFSLAAEIGVPDCPKSRDVPGVLGVFAVEPKDAKAPDPRPNAEDAPDVGDATPVVVRGVIPLVAFALPPKAPSPPNLLVAEKLRVESGLVLSLVLAFELEVESDSLLEFERLCHKLSMSGVTEEQSKFSEAITAEWKLH